MTTPPASSPRDFSGLLGTLGNLAGELLRGPTALDGVYLAHHRAPAHVFDRGRSDDLLIVAQQNHASTSVEFDLGHGWREHLCATPTAVYVVPGDADARWRLDGDSQCIFLALPQIQATDLLREFDVGHPVECLWALASRGFDDAFVHELVHRLWQEVLLVGPSPLLISSCRVTLLHALARRFQRAAMRASRTAPRLHRATLARVLEVLHELPSDGLSVERLATAAGLSAFHFTRLFRNSTGRSPYQYYDELRFQRARDLLVSTSLSIAEIGTSLGFTGPSQFARAFRRHAGCSPRAYRRDGVQR